MARALALLATLAWAIVGPAACAGGQGLPKGPPPEYEEYVPPAATMEAGAPEASVVLPVPPG